jgi:hypothetical protein
MHSIFYNPLSGPKSQVFDIGSNPNSDSETQRPVDRHVSFSLDASRVHRRLRYGSSNRAVKND